jgi:8-amino-7-oxononanoate synthase
MGTEHFCEELEQLRRAGLFRSRITLQGPQGARIKVDGREFLAFCSNDYLGLANEPRVIAAVAEAVQRYGVGSGASHLVTGHSTAHERVEEALAQFVRMPRALLFSAGYLANIGVITALAGRDDALFSDALNHASLIDGMRLSRAAIVRVPHCDADAFASALAQSRARSRLIVTEGVFSMDGDSPPLAALLELCERFDAWLVLDDAHGFGVLGTEGRGTLEHFNLESPRLIYIGTLGKAAGVSGAFVAGAAPIIETILQRARSYIYTTATPSFVAAAIEASLDIIRTEPWRRRRLIDLVDIFQRGLRDAGAPIAPSRSPIQPLILGDNDRAMKASRRLRDHGIIVTAIRPPTVPEGTARLRISFSAAHEEADVEALLGALRETLGADSSWQPAFS